MPKDSLYFSHDYNARNDRKIAALVKKHKAAGYGIFWITCEMMHEEGGKIEYDEITLGALSNDCNEDLDLVKTVLEDCINVYKLFTIDGDNLMSNRVLRNLHKRLEISKTRSNAGKEGAKAKQTQANAEQKEAKKERKKESKEIKENKVNLLLNGLGEMEITVFEGCEGWQYSELVSFITNSKKEFEILLMTRYEFKDTENFRLLLQNFVGYIQESGKYQTAPKLKEHFINWINRKNGELEEYINDLKNKSKSKSTKMVY